MLQPGARLDTPDKIDSCISAEIPPDPASFPAGSKEREQAQRLERLVLTNLIHGGIYFIFLEISLNIKKKYWKTKKVKLHNS